MTTRQVTSVNPRLRVTLFFLFFVSGFCGLLYQVVWMRLAFSAFGIIPPVLSIVISVFMLGLFLGSTLAGNWVRFLTGRLGVSAVYLYAIAELTIAAGAFLVPLLFRWGNSALLNFGGSHSYSYLALSGVFLGLSILPWCIMMGATYPLMVAFLKERSREIDHFSFLYLANVMGAMAGTVLSGFVLIEWLGFQNTLAIAGVLNILIAVLSLSLGQKASSTEISQLENKSTIAPAFQKTFSSRMALFVLFCTGFLSMAMEVIWTRAFTPVLKTQVYSFSALLCVYLFATAVGSALYRRDLKRNKRIDSLVLVGCLALASFLPIVLNDPRWLPSLLLRVFASLLSIVPISGLLGYLTPRIIDEWTDGDPKKVGTAYAFNMLGCIVGPLVAAYLLLPYFGVRECLVMAALPFVAFLFLQTRTISFSSLAFRLASVSLCALSAFYSWSYEESYYTYGSRVEIRRDATATVMSVERGTDKALSVNGVSMTSLTPVTKVMAHLPLGLLQHKPESALMICFGMGTTFRSLNSWDIDVTAVELVPSVAEAFPFYFSDAREQATRPRSKIVIDDGRRYLMRTSDKFDVITIDPPPPVEAASSSLLYSEEFYALAKSRLKTGGILQQWFPGGEDRIRDAVFTSTLRSFRYVRAFVGIEGWGYHLLASDSPIPQLNVHEFLARLPAKAQADLVEWIPNGNVEKYASLMLSLERDPKLIPTFANVSVNDDKPFNEYFLMRRLFSNEKKGSLQERLFPGSWVQYATVPR
jgi:spermidine synthase